MWRSDYTASAQQQPDLDDVGRWVELRYHQLASGATIGRSISRTMS